MLADTGEMDIMPMQNLFVEARLLVDSGAMEVKPIQKLFVETRLLADSGALEVKAMQKVVVATCLLADAGRHAIFVDGMARRTAMQSWTCSTSCPATGAPRRGYCSTSFGAIFVRTSRRGSAERSEW